MYFPEASEKTTSRSLEYNMEMPTLGVVSSIFPHCGANDKDNYECSVQLKNSAVELRKVPIATQCIGLVGIPRVGDLVLVAFIDGDINAPVVIGRLYNDEDRPPLSNPEEVVYHAPYAENPSVRRIHLEFPGGMAFNITDDRVEVKAGMTKVVVQRDGDVVIESQANVSVRAQGNASLESQGSMTISAKRIEIESDGDLKVKSGADMKVESGAAAEFKATGDMKMEAVAEMKIKGATVRVN